MKFLLTLLLTLTGLSSRAVDVMGGVWTWSAFTNMPAMTNGLVTARWVFDDVNIIEGNWYIRLNNDVDTNVTFTLQLGKTLPAGNYVLWFKGWSKNWDGSASTNLGNPLIKLGSDAYSTNYWKISNPDWTNSPAVATAPFSTITFSFTCISTGSIFSTKVQDFKWSGFAVTTNTLAAPANVGSNGDLFYDYTKPTETNLVVIPGNLIHNSSFETGPEWWHYSLKAPLNTNQLRYKQYLDDASYTTPFAHTGTKVIRIAESSARFALYLSPVRLRGVDRRNYTFTWYARAESNSPSTYTAKIKNLSEFKTGYPTNDIYTFATTALTTTWRRETNTFSYSGAPSPELELWFEAPNAAGDTNAIWIDSVSFVEGTNAPAYEPMRQVEFGLRPPRIGGMYDISETPSLEAVVYNSGASSTPLNLVYRVYNLKNEVVQLATNVITATPGTTTNAISLSLPGLGWYHVFAWSPDSPDIDAETSVSWTHIPVDVGLVTNQFLGVHSMATTRGSTSNRMWGASWHRSLSPGGYMQWGDYQTVSNGTFDFSKADFLVGQVASNQIINAVLWDRGASGRPSWAISGGLHNNMVYTNDLYRYVLAVVSRYPQIKYWESENEPTSDIHTTNEYASIVTAEAWGVHDGNPNAVYVAFGGGSPGATTFITNVWTLLDTNTQAIIGAMSFHMYEYGNNQVQDGKPDTGATTGYKYFRDFGIATGKPIWNSETGVIEVGPTRGQKRHWTTYGSFTYPSLPAQYFIHGQSINALLWNHIYFRTKGHGFQHMFAYDDRTQDGYRFGASSFSRNYTLFDYDDIERPGRLSMMEANYQTQSLTSYESITNKSNLEIYMFGDGTSTVAALWSIDKNNQALVLTNSSFGQLDIYGNILTTNNATVVVNRAMKYIVSRVLGTNELRAAILGGSSFATNDTTAPVVSFDLSPAGVYSGATNSFTVKFTVVDDTQVNTPYAEGLVLNRARIPGIMEWTDWNEDTLLRVNNLPNGQYHAEIEAKDAAGNTNATYLSPYWTVTNGVDPRPVFTARSMVVGTLYGK